MCSGSGSNPATCKQRPDSRIDWPTENGGSGISQRNGLLQIHLACGALKAKVRQSIVASFRESYTVNYLDVTAVVVGPSTVGPSSTATNRHQNLVRGRGACEKWEEPGGEQIYLGGSHHWQSLFRRGRSDLNSDHEPNFAGGAWSYCLAV